MDAEILHLARSRRGPYLAALCAPARHQDALLALLALDAELARIPDLVSEPMLGRIRLQWWIDALPSAKAEHPILAALAPLKLDVQALLRLVELRNFNFDEGPATLAQHKAQVMAVGRALTGPMLDVLDVTDESVRGAAGDIAAAWIALEAATTERRVASAEDAQALRLYARSLVDQARRQRLKDKIQLSRALPVLVLAKLVDYKLNHPQGPLGAGAVLRVWWGSVVGRF